MARKFEVFDDFRLNRQLLTSIAGAGFVTPTPIQKKCIPRIQSGQDVIGIAQTGTGKTAAYLIPVISMLGYAQGKDPRAIIIVPARELVLQVKEHADIISSNTDLRIAAIYGGIGPNEQKKLVQKGTDMVISTPKRLLEFYLSGDLILKNVRHFILDEAERLLDLGFKPQIHRLLEILPRKKQNLLFSATFSDRVNRLAMDFIAFPNVIQPEPEKMAAPSIRQVMYRTNNKATKMKLLKRLLSDKANFSKVIIFCRTRASADTIGNQINESGSDLKARVIHANKGQNTRINALTAFRNGDVNLLVATDVSARGIDIPEVSHVINFDVPLVPEDYVHRIGRTGRVNLEGDAITFCTSPDEDRIDIIEKIMGEKIQRLELPPGTEIEKTPFDEKQFMARELDEQKKKKDPSFKGAFHDKKHEHKPLTHRKERKRKNG